MQIVRMILGLIAMLSVFGGANFYVAGRLFQWIRLIFPNSNAKIYIGVSVVISLAMLLGFLRSFLPIPLAVKKLLNGISSYWMGIFLYLLLLILLADAVIWIGGLTKIIPSPLPQSVRFYQGLVPVLLTVGIVCYGVFHAYEVKHVSYEIQLKDAALNNMKIILISDSHMGAFNSFEHNLERIVKDINDRSPDIVCFVGDIFNDDFNQISNPDKAVSLLKGIVSTYGVYACLGNHDGGDTLEQMIGFLEESNIRLLNDEYVIIDDRLVLIGRLEQRPIGGFGDRKRKDTAELLSSIDADLPIVVMDHNPAVVGQYGEDVDLILSGHSHKGQVFPGNLLTKAIYVVDYGHYQKDENSPHIIVTSGVSTWGPPLRVGTDNEIVSITLR